MSATHEFAGIGCFLSEMVSLPRPFGLNLDSTRTLCESQLAQYSIVQPDWYGVGALRLMLLLVPNTEVRKFAPR